jgi:ParB family chromosome partitioning protein
MPSKQKNSGLGQGIEGLLPTEVRQQQKGAVHPDTERQETGKPLDVKISEISYNPDQPRKTFASSEMEQLSDSIRQKGVIEPLVVRRKGQGFELLAGHRRLIASDKAGLKTVPAVVRDMEDDPKERLEIALVENIYRSDLNPMELAEAYQRLSDEWSRTDEEIAKLVGLSRPAVTGARRLLLLPDEIKDDIRWNRMTAGHGAAILQIDDKDRWQEARKIIIKDALSVRKAEALAKRFNREARKGKGDEGRDLKLNAFYEDLERKFTDSLNGLKVKIYYSGKVKRMEIRYTTNEEMEGIMTKLGVAAD